jgi:hypothetical protein
VTVVPDLTVMVAGRKAKLLIVTALAATAGPAGGAVPVSPVVAGIVMAGIVTAGIVVAVAAAAVCLTGLPQAASPNRPRLAMAASLGAMEQWVRKA